MNKQDYEELLTLAISTGADFAEIYLEDGISKNFQVVNSKLDNISTRTSKGIGIRLIKDNDYYYSSTNDLRKNNIKKIIKSLIKNTKGKSDKKVTLNDLEKKYSKIKIPHNQYSIEKKKGYLLNIDKKIRKISNKITQVSLALLEDVNVNIKVYNYVKVKTL